MFYLCYLYSLTYTSCPSRIPCQMMFMWFSNNTKGATNRPGTANCSCRLAIPLQMLLVDHGMLTILEHLSSPLGFSWIRVARPLVFFVDHCPIILIDAKHDNLILLFFVSRKY